MPGRLASLWLVVRITPSTVRIELRLKELAEMTTKGRR